MQECGARTDSGYLLAVGLGISLGHLTRDCERALRDADIVFCLTNNAASLHMVQSLNPNVHNLDHCYAPGKPRMETYEEMIGLVLTSVFEGLKVCLAAYGHPGVFAYPTHQSIQRAREKGYQAAMLPGISAEDCLFADLGLDPALHGCQSFDASDFLVSERIWDPYSTLVLWQVPVVGVKSLPVQGVVAPGHEFLFRRLIDVYGPKHKGILYEASPFPFCKPRMDELPLSEMKPDLFHSHTTLVIKPTQRAPRVNEEFAKAVTEAWL